MTRLLGRAFAELQTPPAKGFCFFTISGLSAAGKDVLLHRTILDIDPCLDLSILRKFVVRTALKPANVYEDHVDTVRELNRKVDTGEAVLRYSADRGRDYAFSAAQFIHAYHRGHPLVAVLTETQFVPQIIDSIRTKGGNAKSIWIEAPDHDLDVRTLFRTLGDDEKGRRQEYNRRLRTQIRRVGEDKFLAAYDHVVINDDGTAVAAAAKRIRVFIEDATAEQRSLCDH